MLKIGAAVRVVGGRKTLEEPRLTGFRIMFCWKREGEEAEMLVGDSGVVGEIDGLVTGSLSVFEWWWYWVAATETLGLRVRVELMSF